jgi:hypothetical protein
MIEKQTLKDITIMCWDVASEVFPPFEPEEPHHEVADPRTGRGKAGMNSMAIQTFNILLARVLGDMTVGKMTDLMERMEVKQAKIKTMIQMLEDIVND